jgi:sortase A
MVDPYTKPRKKRLRNWLIPAGLAVMLLGAMGLGYELLKPTEDEVFQELLITYDQEAGFAPYFSEPETPAHSDAEPQETTVPQDPSQDADTLPEQQETPRAYGILGWVPDNLQIPSIGLDAVIVPVDHVEAQLYEISFNVWRAPVGGRVGWHSSSALLGVGGNTVLNGHHNAYGKVFEHLIDVKEGDLIYVSSGEQQFQYIVTIKVLFPERFQTFETRMENTAWIEPTDSERITLVTCWPATSNTHRLVIVAEPYSSAVDAPDTLGE